MSDTKYDSRPETQQHIDRVRFFIATAIANLQNRLTAHDRSKLEEPEVSVWDEVTPKLADTEYGSEEYRATLRAIRPTLEHHYKHNDHHPEHYGEDGVRGMSLMALIEMLCDWRAASERGKQRTDGDTHLAHPFEKSLEYNRERWGYSDDLAQILYNTCEELGFFE